jgi:hypothetical protein
LPAGIYFMQVEAGDVKDIQKLILVK